ncbi:MAG: metalloregulator ArsR/SmtB family transcription factor [Novosphingobium sp.]
MKPTDLSELKSNAAQMATLLKIMSHPDRLLILCRLDEDEASVTQLVELSGQSQSAVSQHLALLRQEDIVSIRAEAQTRYYKLKDPVVRATIHALCEVCDNVDTLNREKRG